MAELEYCKHDILAMTCDLCNPRPGAFVPKEPVDVGVMITARFGGKCANCGENYSVGERIGRAADLGWVCPGCVR